MDAIRIASNMLRLSEQVHASVPIPTRTPASRRARAAASPFPSLALEPGLWATAAPASASRRISSRFEPHPRVRR